MTVPPGFRESSCSPVKPEVHQPIAMCIDDRGRLWVAEAYSYPQRQPEGKGKDRIVIFEDAWTATASSTSRTSSSWKA